MLSWTRAGNLGRVSLRLFDTATREVRPRVPGEVGIYLCGATVQGAPHIGHMRAAVAFDVLVRWLEHCGTEVTMIRNVTDIDDKILQKSADEGRPWWAHAAIYEREFTQAYNALGILPPTYEPRATGHITDMIELMQRLVDSGHAYATSPGNVYFDVRSWPEYGSLTNQRPEDLTIPGESGGEPSGKRGPRDFALWKANRPGEPDTAAWHTPFGLGRPGWHLECSAMARRYLGEAFDIHGGGLDLRFPHHENEQAQSHAAGYDFAGLWMHSAWVTQGGSKMSKSLGNGLLVSELLTSASPAVLRYALTAVQYRSMLEWTQETLTEAETIWDRLSGFVQRAQERVGTVSAEHISAAELPSAFVAAMDDDLNVPVALASVHETLRAGNSALAAGDDAAALAAVTALRAMLGILGLDPGAEPWVETSGTDHGATALDTLVADELQARAAARADRDFAKSDAIRDRLAAAGVIVEDSSAGARWSLAPQPTKDVK